MKNNSTKIIICFLIVLGLVAGAYAYRSEYKSTHSNEDLGDEMIPQISTSTNNLNNNTNVKPAGSEVKPVPTTSASSDFKTKCVASGGKWSDHYNGCLGVEGSSCENIGGKFDACAANCTSTPDGEACTSGCLRICRQ